jgi:hypothetical protein
MKNIPSLVVPALGVVFICATTAGAQTPVQPKADAGRILEASLRLVERSTLKAPPVGGARRPIGEALRAQDVQSGGATESPKAFFRSPKGLAVVAVLGAGVGYAAYSKVHDRVHSKNPER